MMVENKVNILVLSEFDNNNANVIRDYLFSFRKYSNFNYFYITNLNFLTGHFDFERFDVILIFWSVYLFGKKISDDVKKRISDIKCLKIVFIQDEYRNINEMQAILNKLKVNLIFTCVAEQDQAKFYPIETISTLIKTITVLTGYVPEYLENDTYPSFEDKGIDICYRSRKVPYWLGDLGREKIAIAENFKIIAEKSGFSHDISVEENDRIYGTKWIGFLRNAKFALGTESGASVCDFSGKIRNNVDTYLVKKPDALYDEIKELFFNDIDGRVTIATVSPRVFEAIACGCVLIQYEGEYSGILEPYIHYIPVKKDYSNIEDVVDKMKDDNYCRQVAKQAFEDIIISRKYNYESFICKFDQIVDRNITFCNKQKSPHKLVFYIHNYLFFNQRIVPLFDTYIKLPMSPLFILNQGFPFLFSIIFIHLSFIVNRGIIILHQMINRKANISFRKYFNIVKEYRYLYAILKNSNNMSVNDKYFACIYENNTENETILHLKFDAHNNNLDKNEFGNKWMKSLIRDIELKKIKKVYLASDTLEILLPFFLFRCKFTFFVSIPNIYRFKEFEDLITSHPEETIQMLNNLLTS